MPKSTDVNEWARSAVREVVRRCLVSLAARLEREAHDLRTMAKGRP